MKINFALTPDQVIALDLALYYFHDQLSKGHIALQGEDKEYYLHNSKSVLDLINTLKEEGKNGN